MLRVIALVGRSGSGKSTGAELLNRVAGAEIVHARSAIPATLGAAEWARLSRRAKLVTGVEAAVLSEVTNSRSKMVVLDGFPRSAEQLKLLLDTAHAKGWALQLVYFEMPKLSGIARSIGRQFLRCFECGGKWARVLWKFGRDNSALPSILEAASKLHTPLSIVDGTAKRRTVEEQIRRHVGLEFRALQWDVEISQLVASVAPEAWITGGGHNYRPFFNNVFGPPSDSWDVDLRVAGIQRAIEVQSQLSRLAPKVRWHVKDAISWARTELGRSARTVEETIGMNPLICLCMGMRWTNHGMEFFFSHPEAERDLWRGVLRPNPNGHLAFAQAKARKIAGQYPAVEALCWGHEPVQIPLTFSAAMDNVRSLEQSVVAHAAQLLPGDRAAAEQIQQLLKSLPQRCEAVPWPAPAPLPDCDPWLAPDSQFRIWVVNQTRSRNPIGGSDAYLQNALALQAGIAQKPTHQGSDLRTHAIRSLLTLNTDHLPIYRLHLRIAMLWHDIGKRWNIINPGCHAAMGARKWRELQGAALPGITPDDEALISHFIRCHDLLGRVARTVTDPNYPGGLSPARALSAMELRHVDPHVMVDIAKTLWCSDVGSIPMLRWLLPLADPVAELLRQGLSDRYAR
jgi:adenylate kinase family enzyme